MSAKPTRGVVKAWHDDEGWGVIESPELPEGESAWVHYSALTMDGYRSLSVGQPVSFTYEQVDQDGYRYRADAVTTD